MAENEMKSPQEGGPAQEDLPGKADLPGEADLTGKVADLEQALAGKTEELNKSGLRAVEMEKALSEANGRADLLAGSLKKVFSGYKSLIVQANPDVLPELIGGETIEALDGSLVKARELIGKVRAGLENQKASHRVPAGAPQRGVVDIAGLSSREKINLGVERTRK